MTRTGAKKITTSELACTALFTALIAVCAWISIPTEIPFTLQTFGVFLTIGVLGGKLGTLAVAAYLLLGAVGAPVFAGFSGGLGVLLGSTGGYLLGFLGTSLTMWATERILGRKTWTLVLSMVLGLIVCYAFGTVWFMVVYARTDGPIGWMTALGWCVLPYLPVDALKIAMAAVLCKRLAGLLKLR